MTIAEIAEVCHEVNRAYCTALGDTSQVPWAEAPDWQRTSIENGVRHRLRNPQSRPADSHESWLREKKDAGWRWGPVKDVEKKEHPCFCSYDQLPTEQKVKDFLFLGVVDVLAVRGVSEL